MTSPPTKFCLKCINYLYSGPAKLKPATHVKVRHILCEKQSKALEALEKVKAGEKFEQVIPFEVSTSAHCILTV